MIKRYCISIGVTALLYFLVAKLIFSFLQLGIEPSPLWPPAGIGLFVLLQQGWRVWPGISLGVLLVGSWLNVSWILVSGSAIGSTIEALAGATLLRRIGFQDSMERLQDVLNFIVIAGLIAPGLNATVNTGAGLWAGSLSESQLGQNWWTFWLGDCMGILVFTPLLLTLNYHRNQFQQASLKRFALLKIPRLGEKLLCFSLLIGLSWAVFHSHPSAAIINYPIEYLPFPLVIWAALRFGQATGIVASFVLSMIAISGTLADQGPFITMTNINSTNVVLGLVADTPHQVILLLQAFLGVITTTALILAAVSSERRHVESLLRHNQASLTRAQELARLGNWDFDFKQQQWRWSDQLYRLLGWNVQSIAPCQQAYLAAVHPNDRFQVKQALQNALEQRIPYRLDYRLLLPNGTERIVEEQVVINATNATGTVLDITEHKRTEEKLRLTAERNRLLSEMALRIRRSLDVDAILNTTVQEVRQFLQADRVFICRFDAMGQGRVVAESVLPEWNSALGMLSDASLYPEIQAIFAEEQVCVCNDTSQQEHPPFIRQYHDLYQVRAGVGVAIISDSENSGLGNSGLGQPNPGGNSNPVLGPAHLFGLIIAHQCSRPRQWQPLEIELLEQLSIQVTIALQQGQLYQQVQQLNSNLEHQVIERTLQLQVNLEKLEEMNELQNVFLHAIAHDLRTTIMGTLMVLKNFQQHPGDEISIPRSMLERMTQSGEIQLCKLDSLLEAYKNKTEGLTLQQEPVQISGLLQIVIADLNPLFQQNQATLELDMADLPLIVADPMQLQRLFKHLLVNAVKHNPPGVAVTLRAKTESGWLRFMIEDNGKGINPAQCDRIFNLAIGGGQERQRAGIGVGLCLCQQIVLAHGGEIGLESEPGVGSRFWFTLPLSGGGVALNPTPKQV